MSERVSELSELSRSSDLSDRALRRVGRVIEAVICLAYIISIIMPADRGVMIEMSTV